MDRHGRTDELDGLTHIGVDELSYRRHHEYITVVVDHLRGEIIWARRGKNAETLKAFFDELGAKRAAKLEAVTIDMSGAYIKAVTEASPNAQIIFDRFHVQRLAHDALDEVAAPRSAPPTPSSTDAPSKGHAGRCRRTPGTSPASRPSAARRSRRPTGACTAPTCSRAAWPPCSTASNPRWLIRRKLGEWIAWASRSRLQPFRRVAKTIRKHAAGILAYVSSRLSNARVEGLNGKIRTTRRSYGLHSAESLIAMLRLCCAGIGLAPVFTRPNQPTTPL